MAILLGRGKSWREPGDAEDVRRDEGDINTPAESYKDGKTKIFIPNNLSAFNEGQMVFSSAKPKVTQTFLFFLYCLLVVPSDAQTNLTDFSGPGLSLI